MISVAEAENTVFGKNVLKSILDNSYDSFLQKTNMNTGQKQSYAVSCFFIANFPQLAGRVNNVTHTWSRFSMGRISWPWPRPFAFTIMTTARPSPDSPLKNFRWFKFGRLINRNWKKINQLRLLVHLSPNFRVKSPVYQLLYTSKR